MRDVQCVASDWHNHRGESRKGLVEPQVVPPAHRDEVAEPHVREFVQDRLGATFVGSVSHLGAEDVVLEDRDGAGVLHRPGVELGNEDLVVLLERVLVVEQLLEVVETLLRHVQDGLGVEVLDQRLAAEHSHRDSAVLVANRVRTARRSAR